MAAFETIVRPSVFPNIRPPRTRIFSATGAALRTITEPGEGFAVIHGNPAKQINLTTSTSISISRSNAQETQRRVDRARIYQVDANGNINKENFVDVDVANRLRLKDGSGTLTRYYRRIQPSDNVEILQRDLIYNTPQGGIL